jgi:hypothetical protein
MEAGAVRCAPTVRELAAGCSQVLVWDTNGGDVTFAYDFVPLPETWRAQKLQVRAEGIGDAWDRDAGVRR